MINTKEFLTTKLRKYQQQQNHTFIYSLDIKRTKWLFFALCFYLISQGFTIPVLPIGTWATWPNLSDLATCLLLLAFVINLNSQKSLVSSGNKQIFYLLIFILLASTLSHLGYLNNLTDKDAVGTRLGIYQLYRLVQFIVIFWVTAQVPLTPERLNLLKKIITSVLIFVCLSIILTFAGIVPLGVMIAHLPQDPSIAGPWASFASEVHAGEGWGTIGYNHAYVSVQVIMLVSLRIHLGLGKQEVFNFCLLFLSIFACLLSGSRAGLFSMIFFAAIYLLKKPAYMGVVITIAILLLSIGAIASLPNLASGNTETSIIERQSTLLDAGNTENLSGRDDIWVERLAFLDEEPIRWLVGIGFGAAWDHWSSGESAHMLPLHIIVENGIIGLLIFCVWIYQILYYLYRYEPMEKSIYWVTITLLLGSLTQETFYPVTAFGNFTGFYLCSVALALRSRITVQESSANQRL